MLYFPGTIYSFPTKNKKHPNLIKDLGSNAIAKHQRRPQKSESHEEKRNPTGNFGNKKKTKNGNTKEQERKVLTNKTKT